MRIERLPGEVPTRAPTGTTASYLVGRDECLLVDPAALNDRIEATLDDVEHVAVTHHHADHVGAVNVAAEMADATVWCRYGREQSFREATGVDPDRTFREETTIPVDDGTVRVHETPGHAVEHVAFGVDRSLLVGDLAVESGSVVVGPPDGDMRAYLTSLRRVWSMAPRRLYPAHGQVIDAPRRTCERLIDHRLEREASVLTAVQAGNHTLDSIVDAAYAKDISDVRGLATRTVRAHLRKLDTEGKLRWDGGEAHPRS